MTILFPLSNLRSLLALAPLSMAGVAAVAATTGFLGFRCPSINPFSPYLQGTGALIGTLPSIMRPQFNTFDKGIVSPSATVLMGMAATAYLGHFSAPSFFASLRSKDAKKDARDFRAVTGLGFGIATLLNCLVMAFGFLTFGGASSGVILNNFSTMDPGASICRLLMAVCVIGGFPFLTRSVVTEYLGLRGVDSSSRPEQKRATLQVLGLLTAAALAMKDAGFVIGFSGAVMGSFIVYIFPALLFLSQSGRTLSSSSLNWRIKAERTFCKGLVVLGGIVAALGGGVSVANSYFPHLLS
jgi:sodium-coupled neutral amino acid transporter 11